MQMVDMDSFHVQIFRSLSSRKAFSDILLNFIFFVIPLVLWQLISVHVRQVFGCDVFAHAKQIGGFSAGTEVSFAILLNKDSKPQAFDIEELSPSPASMGKGKGAMMVEHSG